MESQNYFRFRAHLRALVANLRRAELRAAALKSFEGVLPNGERRSVQRVREQVGFAFVEAKWLNEKTRKNGGA